LALSRPATEVTVRRSRVAGAAGVWLVLALATTAAAITLFGHSIVLVVDSFGEPEFSYGYLLVLISGWIVWQRRRAIWWQRTRGARSGWLVVTVACGFAVFCHAADLLTPPYLVLLMLLVGLAAATLGWAAARLLLVPLGFLALAYPLPDYLYIELSTRLQLVSSQIGVALLDAIGVPVLLDGNIIDLGAIKLQVAEACSGLRYLLPLISFGVLCAFIYRAPLWSKLVVLAVTIPLAIVLNGLRIGVTGLFVHSGSTGLAEGFMHLFEGWVVFLMALAILFATMFALLRLQGRRTGFLDMFDFDRLAAGTASPGARSAPAVTPPLASVATLVLAAAVLVPLAARSDVVPARPGLVTYPMALGDWRGSPAFIDDATEEILDADDHLLADFVAPSAAAPVNLWVAYYGTLLADAHYHSPTTCLPGAGWEYLSLRAYRTPLEGLDGAPLVVNRGVIVKDTQRVVIYFWMELRGRSVEELQYVKFFNLWDSLVRGRSDGALVRLYTPLRPGETAEAGDARLLAFLERAYPRLAPYVGA